MKFTALTFIVMGSQAQGSGWRARLLLTFSGHQHCRVKGEQRAKGLLKMVLWSCYTVLTLLGSIVIHSPRQAGNFSFILLTTKVTKIRVIACFSSQSLHHRVLGVITVWWNGTSAKWELVVGVIVQWLSTE